MKASKEIRKWVNWMRKKYGKKNGVIRGFYFDQPDMERKDVKSKKNYRRSKFKLNKGE
jgi:hypothetical protein